MQKENQNQNQKDKDFLNPKVFAPKRFSVGDPESKIYLKEMGFCLFKDIITKQQQKEILSDFWDF